MPHTTSACTQQAATTTRPAPHRPAFDQSALCCAVLFTGARFQRIVLAPTCLSDHFPIAYKAALLTVASSMKGGAPAPTTPASA
jgi:hypothetical protein